MAVVEQEFHDRTNLMIQALGQGIVSQENGRNLVTSPIVVYVEGRALATHFGEAATIMVANQAVRIFKNIDFIVPAWIDESVKRYPIFSRIPESTSDVFIDGLRGINKWGAYRVLSTFPRNEKRGTGYTYEYAICIGKPRTETRQRLARLAKYKIFVTGKGWRAFLSPRAAGLPSTTTRELDTRASAIGGMLAAILAVNDAVKRVLHMNNVLFIDAPVMFSAFDYSAEGNDAGPELPDTVDIGTAVVAGLGAIGGIMVSMIPLLATPFKGSLCLVDFDVLEVHNMNRVLCAGLEDIGKSKVSVANDFLKRIPWLSQLVVECESARLEDAVMLQDRRVDIIFTLVDSIIGRKNAQDILPKSIINAGTDGFTSEVFVSRNLIDDTCLNCIFDPPSVLASYARGVLIKRLESELGKGNVRPWFVTHEAIEAIEQEIEARIVSESERQQRHVSIEEAVAMVAGIKHAPCGEAPRELLRLHDVDVPSPTLPQVSALPALLCLLESIKIRHFPDKVLQNRWQTNLLGRIDYSLKQRYPRKEGCLCTSDELRNIYRIRHKLD